MSLELMVIGYASGALFLHVWQVHRETATVREYLSVLWEDFLDWAWK